MVSGHFANLFGLLHLFVFLLCGLFFWSCTSAAVMGALRGIQPLAAIVDYVAALTLEFYLIHSYLLEAPFKKLHFPISVIAIFLATALLAWPLTRAARAIQRLIEERPAVRTAKAPAALSASVPPQS